MTTSSDTRRILLVEDEKAIRDAVAAYLERENYWVSAVGDGQEALEEFSRHHFDLVVLDLMLPKVPGERVCRAIRDNSDVPIIMLTAKGEVEDRIIGLELGADDYLVKPFSPRELVARVRALLRRVIATGTKITQLGYNAGGAQAQDVINLAQAEAYEMGEGKVHQDYVPLRDAVNTALDQIDRIQKGEIEAGIPTGFREIDAMTKGLQPGQMVVVAGRPAMGKSTLGVDFARSAALKHHEPTVIFSLEMSRIELAQRIIAAETNIPLAAMRNPDDIDPGRWNVLNDFYGKLESAPLYIDDSPNMSLMEIRAKCRRLKQTQGLKLVVIDYLQLMSSGKQVESRQQEVSEFSRALKLLAKELELPVVALSQLNRNSETRNDRKPQISDLRESGSIEQDADVIFLVHRPDVYDKEDRPGEADIIMAKHRNGPTATFQLGFQGQYSRFSDMAQNMQQGV